MCLAVAAALAAAFISETKARAEIRRRRFKLEDGAEPEPRDERGSRRNDAKEDEISNK